MDEGLLGRLAHVAPRDLPSDVRRMHPEFEYGCNLGEGSETFCSPDRIQNYVIPKILYNAYTQTYEQKDASSMIG